MLIFSGTEHWFCWKTSFHESFMKACLPTKPMFCSREYQHTSIASNIFHFEGGSYLLVVDYTSRFLVVHKLTSMTGPHIANQCKLIFSEYGWPETLVSDNGPCYTVEVFTNLMREYNINHITRSPHYSQSNGSAEKYLQLVRNLFYKAKEEGKDLFKCLMVYHNTPLSNNLQSPMQILASRSARSDLPISNAARKQLGIDCENLRTKYRNEHGCFLILFVIM